MRCPYCRRDIRVSGRFCPQCGRQIFGLPMADGGAAPQPVQPSRPATEPPTEAASATSIGKTCPYDQYPIAAGDEVILCPACGTPHHADCWRENRGCTTYGCAQAPMQAAANASAGQVATPVGYGPPVSGPMDRPPYLVIMAAEAERNATNALLYALIGLPCCPVLSIVAFFMAVAVFGALERTGLDTPGARMKATWAIAIGALGPVAWITFLLTAVASAPSY